MNPIVLAVGLLVLAYLGSVVFRGRLIPGFGSASGCEYLLIGVVIGPAGLGFLPRELTELFAPILAVGAAWLFFLASFPLLHDILHFRRYRAALLGVVSGVVFGLAAYFTLHALAIYLLHWDDDQARSYAFAGAWIGTEMTHHGVRWARRQGAKGQLIEDLLLFARSSHLTLVTGAALVQGGTQVWLMKLDGFEIPAVVGGMVAGAGLGVLLGLLHRLHRHDHADWGLLLGTVLLLTGACIRAQISPIPAASAMGVGFSLWTRGRTQSGRELADTEHAVMVPFLVLAGALVVWPDDVAARIAIVAVALVKVFWRWILGAMVARTSVSLRRSTHVLGLSTSASGGCTLAAATLLALQVPSSMSSLILAAAVATALLGEIVAPSALRRVIERSTDARPVEEANDLQVPATPESDDSQVERDTVKYTTMAAAAGNFDASGTLTAKDSAQEHTGVDVGFVEDRPQDEPGER